MGKMQDINFRSVEEFLDFLPDNERKIVDHLRYLILDCIPECKEKLAYNVPFYYKHRRICFIWPPAVPWGKGRVSGVELGFCYGNLLQDEINYLDKGERKQVYMKIFTDVSEIDADLIRAYLFEAAEIDERMNRK